MEKATTRNLLRAQVNTPVLYRIFNVAFALLLFGVLALVIFFNTNTFYLFQWYWLLCAAAGGVLLTLLAYWVFTLLPEPGKRAERIIAIGLLLVFLVVQFFISWDVQVEPNQSVDYGMVYEYALDYALFGTLPDDYFLHFPNDIAQYTLLCLFFSLLHLFGLWNFMGPTMVLNILAITGSVVLLYFVCRKLFGVRQGILLMLVAFATAPFLLYVPILCADVLVLPIPIAMVLLWLKVRTAWRQGNLRRALVYFLLISLLCAVGCLFKLSIIVVWVAVALDLLLFLSGKGRLRMLLAGLLALLVVYCGCSLALRHAPLLPQYDYANDGMPVLYGVMSGLSGEGDYNEDDLQLVLAQEDRSARSDYVWEEIKDRLAEKGPLGVVQHLGTKLSYTFGDGTYAAAGLLDQSAENSGIVQEFVTPSGGFFGMFAYLCFGIEAAVLFWMAFGAVRSFLRKNEALTFVRVAVLGLVLFVLIGESGARHLVAFLPLFLLCAMEAGPRPVLQPKQARPTGEMTPVAAALSPLAAGEAQSPPLTEKTATPDYMDPSFQWEQPLLPQQPGLPPEANHFEGEEWPEIVGQSPVNNQQADLFFEQGKQESAPQEDIFSLMDKD